MFLNSIFLQLVNKATVVKLLWKYQKELEIKCFFFIIFRFVCYIKNGKYKKDPNSKALTVWNLNVGHIWIWVQHSNGIWIQVQYSKAIWIQVLKWRSFEYWTIFHHLSTRQAWYSDPHCILVISWAEPTNLQNDYHKCFFYHSRVSEDNCNSDFILVHLK